MPRIESTGIPTSFEMNAKYASEHSRYGAMAHFGVNLDDSKKIPTIEGGRLMKQDQLPKFDLRKDGKCFNTDGLSYVLKGDIYYETSGCEVNQMGLDQISGV